MSHKGILRRRRAASAHQRHVSRRHLRHLFLITRTIPTTNNRCLLSAIITGNAVCVCVCVFSLSCAGVSGRKPQSTLGRALLRCSGYLAGTAGLGLLRWASDRVSGLLCSPVKCHCVFLPNDKLDLSTFYGLLPRRLYIF